MADDYDLYLLVNPSGAKLWKFKFRFRGVEKKLTLSRFPAVSLKAARTKCEDARRLLADGLDPAALKRNNAIEGVLAASNTFRSIADEYIEKIKREGRAPAAIVPLSTQVTLFWQLRALENAGGFMFPVFHTSLRAMWKIRLMVLFGV